MRNKRDEARKKGQIRFDSKAGLAAMGAAVVIGSLILARLLTWLTHMAIGG